MKKLIGNFTTRAEHDAFNVWKPLAEGETYETTFPMDRLKDGYLIFDETTVHGAILFTALTSDSWVDDLTYDVVALATEKANNLAIRQANEDQRIADAKAEQDLINDTENKPRIISALDDLPYHERTKAQYDTFSYEVLRSYFTLMVGKQNHIKEILELKFLEGTRAEWDIEGAKTDAVLQAEIATLKADETRTRPPPPPVDNTENIINIKLALDELEYPDKNQTEIDALSYEELTEYHSKMVSKQNVLGELIEIKYDDSILKDELVQIQNNIKLNESSIKRIDNVLVEDPTNQDAIDHKALLEAENITLQAELNTKATTLRGIVQDHWDVEGAKTYEVIVLEIESLRPSDEE